MSSRIGSWLSGNMLNFIFRTSNKQLYKRLNYEAMPNHSIMKETNYISEYKSY